MNTWNDTGLQQLGRALKLRGYAFIQPSVPDIKNYRRSPGYAATAAESLFGWGVAQQAAAVDPDLLALMDGAGVLARGADGSIGSNARAASVGGELLFHTSGPNAAEDAVFLGPDTYRFIEALDGEPAPARAPRLIVEVGSGSGAASIWLARRFPDAQVLGYDINPLAVRLARVNAALSGVSNVAFHLGDALAGVGGQPDLIVSNPPFIADVRKRVYRDGGSLLGLELPLRILREALACVAPDGRVAMYTASPVIGGEHFIAPHLAALSPAPALRELEPAVFNGLLGSDAYAQVERIAAVLITGGGR